MSSKGVVRRERSTLAVVKATEQFGGDIGAALAALLRPELQSGEAMPDLALVTTLVKRALSRRIEALVKANDASELELSDDAEPRARRDRLDAAIRRHISAARATVSDLYGAEGLAAYKITAPPETGAAPLVRYATAVVQALRAPRAALTTVFVSSAISFSAAALAHDLAPLITELERALDDVAREKAEAAQVTVVRSAAVADNDTAFVALAGLVEAMARAAGRHELADRIRPSAREPGVLLEEPEGPVDDVVVPVTPKPAIDPGMPGADPFES